MNRISDADRFHEVVIDAVPSPTEEAFHEGDPIGSFTIFEMRDDRRQGRGRRKGGTSRVDRGLRRSCRGREIGRCGAQIVSSFAINKPNGAGAFHGQILGCTAIGDKSVWRCLRGEGNDVRRPNAFARIELLV